MDRRGFLRGFAALAACAVIPTTAVASSVASNSERLMAAMRSGVISGETFIFDGPITIGGFESLSIYNCNFLFKSLQPNECAITIENGTTLTMLSCNITVQGAQPDKLWGLGVQVQKDAMFEFSA